MPPDFLRCRRPPRPLTVPGKGAPAAAAFPLSGRSGVHHHPRLDALGWLLLAGAGPTPGHPHTRTPAHPHTRTPARALISKRRDWLRAGARPSSRQRGSCGPATCPRQRTRISSCSGSSWCRRKCGRATSPPPPCPRAPTARVPSPATKSWGPLYGRFGRFGQACGWGGGGGGTRAEARVRTAPRSRWELRRLGRQLAAGTLRGRARGDAFGLSVVGVPEPAVPAPGMTTRGESCVHHGGRNVR